MRTIIDLLLILSACTSLLDRQLEMVMSARAMGYSGEEECGE